MPQQSPWTVLFFFEKCSKTFFQFDSHKHIIKHIENIPQHNYAKHKIQMKYKIFQELFNIHNPNKLSQHHRNILVVNATYACPTLFSLPTRINQKGAESLFPRRGCKKPKHLMHKLTQHNQCKIPVNSNTK